MQYTDLYMQYTLTSYLNVTMLHSGLCYCKSVCLSVICNVRAPYSWR